LNDSKRRGFYNFLTNWLIGFTLLLARPESSTSLRVRRGRCTSTTNIHQQFNELSLTLACALMQTFNNVQSKFPANKIILLEKKLTDILHKTTEYIRSE